MTSISNSKPPIVLCVSAPSILPKTRQRYESTFLNGLEQVNRVLSALHVKKTGDPADTDRLKDTSSKILTYQSHNSNDNSYTNRAHGTELHMITKYYKVNLQVWCVPFEWLDQVSEAEKQEKNDKAFTAFCANKGPILACVSLFTSPKGTRMDYDPHTAEAFLEKTLQPSLVKHLPDLEVGVLAVLLMGENKSVTTEAHSLAEAENETSIDNKMIFTESLRSLCYKMMPASFDHVHIELHHSDTDDLNTTMSPSLLITNPLAGVQSSEKFGLARIIEVLQAIMWPHMVMHPPKQAKADVTNRTPTDGTAQESIIEKASATETTETSKMTTTVNAVDESKGVIDRENINNAKKSTPKSSPAENGQKAGQTTQDQEVTGEDDEEVSMRNLQAFETMFDEIKRVAQDAKKLSDADRRAQAEKVAMQFHELFFGGDESNSDE
eukprot:g1966.t1